MSNVMFARCAALVVAMSLVGVGCTSGSGKHSTPTTTRIRTRPERLGPCPNPDPNIDLSKVNAGVTRLDKKLVPITASRVRVCLYGAQGKLEREGALVLPNAARFEQEANQFPASPPTTVPQGGGLPGSDCPQDWYHVVTFASDSQQVDLREVCGRVGNGVLQAQSTMTWFNDLQRLARGRDIRATLVEVPNVVGKTELAASVALIRARLGVNAGVEGGRTVTSERPAAGTRVPVGTDVSISGCPNGAHACPLVVPLLPRRPAQPSR
jgi:hypothetical protein